jgi:uncharacterized membrane protein
MGFKLADVNKRLLIDLAAIFLVSAAVTLPIYLNGVPDGNDLPQHYQFAITFRDAVADGTIYPGWAANVNHGYGDVGVRFYPPLAYYVLVLFESAAGNWHDASVIAFTFWFFLGGIGVYLWARTSFAANAALLASALYIVAPYHVNELFNAFTYAEFAAAAILPFCFLFVTRVCRQGRASDILLLAVSFALLILTHLPMMVIGSVSLLVFSLFSIERGKWTRSVLRLGAGVALALSASAFYWLRMVTELSLVRHATDEFRTAAYDFHSNFLAAFMYVSAAEYDERSLWFGDLVLLVTCCIFLPGLVLLLLQRRDRPTAVKLWAPIATLLTAFFFASPLSLPVWERVVFLQYIQFPWRWLAVITLMGTFLFAAAQTYIAGSFSTKLRPLGVLAVGLILAAVVFTAAQVIRPANYMARESLLARTDALAEGKSYESWWPIGASKRAFSVDKKVDAGERQVSITRWTPLEREFHVEAGGHAAARVATFHYPHWKAEVNGSPQAVAKDENGVIIVPVPQAPADVRVYFDEPAYIRNASNASAAVWLLFAIFFLSRPLTIGRRKGPEPD